MGIEQLESRIAPAAVFTYVDDNGHKVTIKTSKGTTTDLKSICSINSKGHLNLINFAENGTIESEFAGTDVTITDGGHGQVNVGVIDATGISLGSVSITGSLGAIDVGTGSGTALALLKVKAINGDSTSYPSSISGDVTTLTVNGAITGNIAVSGTIDTLTANKVLGGSETNSGYVSAADIGTLTVKNGIIGGNGTGSGTVVATGDITTATIGELLGGGGANSARLQATDFDTITVNHNIKGASGTASAEIYVKSGSFTKLLVKGSVLGGQGAQAGRVIQTGTSANDGSVTIKGNLQAGSGAGGASVNLQGNLGALTILGKMDAASQTGGNYAGAVLAKTLAGSNVKVVGGLQNNAIIWVGTPAPGTPYHHVYEIPG